MHVLLFLSIAALHLLLVQSFCVLVRIFFVVEQPVVRDTKPILKVIHLGVDFHVGFVFIIFRIVVDVFAHFLVAFLPFGLTVIVVVAGSGIFAERCPPRDDGTFLGPGSTIGWSAIPVETQKSVLVWNTDRRLFQIIGCAPDGAICLHGFVHRYGNLFGAAFAARHGTRGALVLVPGKLKLGRLLRGIDCGTKGFRIKGIATRVVSERLGGGFFGGILRRFFRCGGEKRSKACLLLRHRFEFFAFLEFFFLRSSRLFFFLLSLFVLACSCRLFFFPFLGFECFFLCPFLGFEGLLFCFFLGFLFD
mmetsp:Transcript_3393/g.9457  ORF Transcript_3393/g.9457 Transcript_3393/m.9457 type:complete len:305 (+) Transcript_3393:987-1901(+)